MSQPSQGKVRAAPLASPLFIAALVALLAVLSAGGVLVARQTPLFASMAAAPADRFRGDAIPANPPFQSLSYAVHTFLWWDDGLTAGIHMDWVQLMSFTHVKQIFAWEDMEPEPGEWHFERSDAILDELERRSIDMVVRLSDAPDWAYSGDQTPEEGGHVDAPPDDYADFANYCRALAERYRGRIAGYQIWNEPNLNREWGGRPPNATEYVDLLRACSEAIRAADPDAVLISAGLAPTGGLSNADGLLLATADDIYLQAMYDAGFEQYVDVVGVHAPGYEYPEYGPDDAARDGRGRWATFRRVEDLREIMIRNGDASRQMAILEFGFTTDQVNPDYQWYAVDQVDQARLLVDAYTYMAEHWRPWVGLVTVIYIPDPTWTPQDEQYWWSITDPAMVNIRPAFAALAQMPKYCGDIVIPARTSEETAFALADNPCN